MGTNQLKPPGENFLPSRETEDVVFGVISGISLGKATYDDATRGKTEGCGSVRFPMLRVEGLACVHLMMMKTLHRR